MRLKRNEKVKIKNFTLLTIFIIIVVLLIAFYISLNTGELTVPGNDNSQIESNLDESDGGID